MMNLDVSDLVDEANKASNLKAARYAWRQLDSMPTHLIIAYNCKPDDEKSVKILNSREKIRVAIADLHTRFPNLEQKIKIKDLK